MRTGLDFDFNVMQIVVRRQQYSIEYILLLEAHREGMMYISIRDAGKLVPTSTKYEQQRNLGTLSYWICVLYDCLPLAMTGAFAYPYTSYEPCEMMKNHIFGWLESLTHHFESDWIPEDHVGLACWLFYAFVTVDHTQHTHTTKNPSHPRHRIKLGFVCVSDLRDKRFLRPFLTYGYALAG